jgi:diadenosine tetraphosphate (Ap4A) HIT family hydrolase
MNSCVFCNDPNIHVREILRDEFVRVFPTNIPITPMHILVVPIRHVTSFTELSQEERDALLNMSARVADVLRGKFGAEGFNFAWNEGTSAGQSVEHLHVHIVPRKTGDTGVLGYEPREFLYRPGSRETAPESELLAVANEIRAALQ